MGPQGIAPVFRNCVLVVVSVAVVALGGYLVKDAVERGAAQTAAKADWRVASRVLAAHLKQNPPLDLGAVWVTHSGRICGLVNGKWSGGYIPGMMPFHARGARIWLVRETTELDFAQGWGECVRDDWFKLVEGSKEAGYCAAREMQARCVTVGGASGVDRSGEASNTADQ